MLNTFNVVPRHVTYFCEKTEDAGWVVVDRDDRANSICVDSRGELKPPKIIKVNGLEYMFSETKYDTDEYAYVTYFHCD